LIENMAAGVAMNDAAVDLLLYGRAEGVVRTSYCDVPCQIRLDWAHPQRGLVDLKTTADIDWFENESRRHRYHHQLSFYQAVLHEVIGQYVPVHLIAVEKCEPFRCGVWRVSDDTLAIARQENEAAIERLKIARRADRWSTGYEDVRLLEIS
ncbi:MAG: PD-(D/E)XK nuclease-like domain-containing protein, partial [Pirellulales bacterium]|nr:PD-(D/E)XK nuclease-like domain-containing protein [Pirellulales bacterium]